MDLSYLAASFLALTAISGALYVLMRLLFVNSITCITDPLNLWTALLSFYLAGALILPSVVPVNRSYIEILILIFIYILSAAVCSRSARGFRKPCLTATRNHQLLFAIFFDVLLLVNLVANQIFGVMPLLAGTQARSELGTVVSPTLVLLAPDISNVLLLIFLLTEFRGVKRAAGLGVALSIASTILNGAKSSAFSIVVLFIVADFVLHLQGENTSVEQEANEIQRKIRKIRRYIYATAAVTLVSFPAYLMFLGADSGLGSSGAIQNIAVRLFGGLDALAGIAIQNIDITAFKDVNLTEFYFFPFYKALWYAPQFQSAGEYVLYLATGSYQFATSGLNPNSSYAIELLLTSGSLVYSAALMAITAALIFSIRSSILRKGQLRIYDLILWSLIVLAPFSQLLDGAYFFIRSYEFIAIYLLFNSIVTVTKNIIAGRLAYEFI